MMAALPGASALWFTTSATTATIACYSFQGQQLDPEFPIDVHFVVY